MCTLRTGKSRTYTATRIVSDWLLWSVSERVSVGPGGEEVGWWRAGGTEVRVPGCGSCESGRYSTPAAVPLRLLARGPVGGITHRSSALTPQRGYYSARNIHFPYYISYCNWNKNHFRQLRNFTDVNMPLWDEEVDEYVMLNSLINFWSIITHFICKFEMPSFLWTTLRQTINYLSSAYHPDSNATLECNNSRRK